MLIDAKKIVLISSLVSFTSIPSVFCYGVCCVFYFMCCGAFNRMQARYFKIFTIAISDNLSLILLKYSRLWYHKKLTPYYSVFMFKVFEPSGVNHNRVRDNMNYYKSS